MRMTWGRSGTAASLVDSLHHQPSGTTDPTLSVGSHDGVVPIIV